MISPKLSIAAWIVLCVLVVAPVEATETSLPPDVQETVVFEVIGNQVKGQIDLLGILNVTFQITFENVIGLNQNSLTITATKLLATDLSLLKRLSDPSQITLPLQLPVLINITPSQNSTLTFTGTYEIELYTKNLTFSPALRLFKAPNGMQFRDITTFSGMGSYRVRGTSGDFSDFLILVDIRNRQTVIQSKLDYLQQTLSSNAAQIEPSFYQSLQGLLDATRSSWQNGQNSEAVKRLESMISAIKLDNGASIPNTHRANDPNTANVAGALRAGAATLIFSLNL
jgi:hypothetical protein